MAFLVVRNHHQPHRLLRVLVLQRLARQHRKQLVLVNEVRQLLQNSKGIGVQKANLRGVVLDF